MMEMPPLPKGKYDWWDDYYEGLTLSEEPEDRYRQLGLYDEDQMRAYGESCARMAREEVIAALRSEIDHCSFNDYLMMPRTGQSKGSAGIPVSYIEAVIERFSAAIRKL